MADAIRDDLADMFTDTVTAHPVTGMDEDGNFTFGTDIELTGRLSEKTRMVRDTVTGQEVVASFKFIANEVNGLSVPKSTSSGWEGHLFTLPTSEGPRVKIKPLFVYRPRDENGVHHEVVMFK